MSVGGNPPLRVIRANYGGNDSKTLPSHLCQRQMVDNRRFAMLEFGRCCCHQLGSFFTKYPLCCKERQCTQGRHCSPLNPSHPLLSNSHQETWIRNQWEQCWGQGWNLSPASWLLGFPCWLRSLLPVLSSAFSREMRRWLWSPPCVRLSLPDMPCWVSRYYHTSMFMCSEGDSQSLGKNQFQKIWGMLTILWNFIKAAIP